MCYGSVASEFKAVTFDSGPIDSALDLGINAHPQDRVNIRKTVTCEPIRTANFTYTIKHNSQLELGLAFSGYNKDSPPQAFSYGRNTYYNTSATFVFNPKTMEVQSSVPSASAPFTLT